MSSRSTAIDGRSTPRASAPTGTTRDPVPVEDLARVTAERRCRRGRPGAGVRRVHLRQHVRRRRRRPRPHAGSSASGSSTPKPPTPSPPSASSRTGPASPASGCSRSPIRRARSRSGSTTRARSPCGRRAPSSGSGSSCACCRPTSRGCGGCSSSSPTRPSSSTTAGSPTSAGGRRSRRPASSSRAREYPNLHLKVTSGVLEAAEAGGHDPRDLVDRLVAEFGADRIVWGTDYPQTRDRPYADLVALGRHACERLSPGDTDLVLGGTAVRLWPELAGSGETAPR